LRSPVDASFMPLLGLSAAIIGIWVEMRRWNDVSEEHES
jgi:hypothetical protein